MILISLISSSSLKHSFRPNIASIVYVLEPFLLNIIQITRTKMHALPSSSFNLQHYSVIIIFIPSKDNC